MGQRSQLGMSTKGKRTVRSHYLKSRSRGRRSKQTPTSSLSMLVDIVDVSALHQSGRHPHGAHGHKTGASPGHGEEEHPGGRGTRGCPVPVDPLAAVYTCRVA